MTESGPDFIWLSDAELTGGTIGRRIAAFLIDGIIVALLWLVLHTLLVVFGVLTLGLGLPLLGLLPFLPPLYNWLSLLSPLSATPGQAVMGLMLRNNDDLSPPSGFASLIWVLGFYVSLALSGLSMLLALFNARGRTLHDIAAGLVVVRAQALTRAGHIGNTDGGGAPFA
jgi:uncharacterized RDD family membrane protein YckC